MESLWILSGTALALAGIHTLLGPDHYLPFLALSRANRWSPARTLAITAACGAGHVLSSVLLGTVGIGAGVVLSRLQRIESLRGALASYLLIGFGLAYAVWGLRQARRARLHSHAHGHTDGTVHDHPHAHALPHRHLHVSSGRLGPWLMIIFGLGPCEPLIPLLMFPAAVHGPKGILVVSAVFGVTTVAAMLACVGAGLGGLDGLPGIRPAERFGHAFAGVAIASCGIAVRAFSL